MHPGDEVCKVCPWPLLTNGPSLSVNGNMPVELKTCRGAAPRYDADQKKGTAVDRFRIAGGWRRGQHP
jgi:hypothetical protein